MIVNSENQEIGDNRIQVNGTTHLTCLFSYYNINDPPNLRIEWENSAGTPVNTVYSHIWNTEEEHGYKSISNRLTVPNVEESTNQEFTCRLVHLSSVSGRHVPVREISKTLVIEAGYMYTQMKNLHSSSNRVDAVMQLLTVALTFLLVWEFLPVW